MQKDLWLVHKLDITFVCMCACMCVQCTPKERNSCFVYNLVKNSVFGSKKEWFCPFHYLGVIIISSSLCKCGNMALCNYYIEHFNIISGKYYQKYLIYIWYIFNSTKNKSSKLRKYIVDHICQGPDLVFRLCAGLHSKFIPNIYYKIKINRTNESRQTSSIYNRNLR